MLNPNQLSFNLLGSVPEHLLNRFPSVIIGIIFAYGVLLFDYGYPSLFQRAVQLVLVMVVGYQASRVTRYCVERLVNLIEGSSPSEETADVLSTAAATVK